MQVGQFFLRFVFILPLSFEDELVEEAILRRIVVGPLEKTRGSFFYPPDSGFRVRGFFIFGPVPSSL